MNKAEIVMETIMQNINDEGFVDWLYDMMGLGDDEWLLNVRIVNILLVIVFVLGVRKMSELKNWKLLLEEICDILEGGDIRLDLKSPYCQAVIDNLYAIVSFHLRGIQAGEEMKEILDRFENMPKFEGDEK